MFAKVEDEGVLGEDSRLLLLLLLPMEDDGEAGVEVSDIDEVEPPTIHPFLFTVRSIALFESEANPLAVIKLMQLLFSNKLALELNFTFDRLEFKGFFILVVRSTGSICTVELEVRKSIDVDNMGKIFFLA